MNAARAGAQAVLIVAAEGTTEANISTPAVAKYSSTAQMEALYLQHVNIPVGIMTHADGALLSGWHKLFHLVAEK